jgi:hypothetical protein
MKTVLFAWELGGGLGHLYQFEPLARRLRARGYRLVYALRDLSQARALLGHASAELWQAPLWMAARRGDLAPISYAEMLMQFGYLERTALAQHLPAGAARSPAAQSCANGAVGGARLALSSRAVRYRFRCAAATASITGHALVAWDSRCTSARQRNTRAGHHQRPPRGRALRTAARAGRFV